MIIRYSAFINARIPSMSFQRILEFCARCYVRVIVAVIFRDLPIRVVSSLTRLRKSTDSTVRS